ncbi:hypothetical protein [Salibacterium aidingense]|uniref:hypothetical protein n=1 Tax=Salibacterium aidingense TaxID=384933 RepID=UPI000419A650|nr:hypothetical protein [Salibacterium aidingense]
MFRFNRRNRRLKKVKKGDGHTLKKYKFWHIFTRSLFHIEIKNDKNEVLNYAVNYKYFVEEPRADLYREGRHIASSTLPATFPVENGVIEVAEGNYGINRMHYVADEKEECPLTPDKRSIRGLRLRLDQHFPRISKLIGVISVITLLAALILELPQLIEPISEIPWISENVGTFISPIEFSVWENIAITGLGALAGSERALLLRNKRLLAML